MDIVDNLNNDLYTILYVDASAPLAAAYIDDFFLGKKDFINSYDDVIYTIVSSNDDKDANKKMDPEDGFLFYQSCIEVIAFKNVNKNVFINRLKSLIDFLRSKGFRTIAACDFEDELNDGKPYTEFMK